MNMGIQIEPPNINRSGLDFTPVADKILFGFSAVRNVGQMESPVFCQQEMKEGSLNHLLIFAIV